MNVELMAEKRSACIHPDSILGLETERRVTHKDEMCIQVPAPFRVVFAILEIAGEEIGAGIVLILSRSDSEHIEDGVEAA